MVKKKKPPKKNHSYTQHVRAVHITPLKLLSDMINSGSDADVAFTTLKKP